MTRRFRKRDWIGGVMLWKFGSLRNLLKRESPPENSLEYFTWLLNRMPVGEIPATGFSEATQDPNDRQLALRVMEAYRRALAQFVPSGSGWDNDLTKLKQGVHDALMSADVEVALPVLRDPASSTFFWGFDAVASSPAGEPEPHELVLRRLNNSIEWRDLYAMWVHDALITLAEVIGARRVAYPETEMGLVSDFKYSVDQIVDEIDERLGFELIFPNPYPGEFGLMSNRGVIGFRAVQAAYQAWRIAQLSNGSPAFKVLEIGAGLGRTAYFSQLFGVKNYTIVDIPLTNAAQGYFLGRVLGADQVCLYEDPVEAALKILPSGALDPHSTYDLVLNVDSWTEMSPDVAQGYWDFAKRATHQILSINHEYNALTVRSLYDKDQQVRVSRFPYPMRRGYVEELVTWS